MAIEISMNPQSMATVSSQIITVTGVAGIISSHLILAYSSMVSHEITTLQTEHEDVNRTVEFIRRRP